MNSICLFQTSYIQPLFILQGGKISEKTLFGVGMELKKVQKQDRGEKPQEPYPTTE